MVYSTRTEYFLLSLLVTYLPKALNASYDKGLHTQSYAIQLKVSACYKSRKLIQQDELGNNKAIGTDLLLKTGK